MAAQRSSHATRHATRHSHLAAPRPPLTPQRRCNWLQLLLLAQVVGQAEGGPDLVCAPALDQPRDGARGCGSGGGVGRREVGTCAGWVRWQA